MLMKKLIKIIFWPLYRFFFLTAVRKVNKKISSEIPNSDLSQSHLNNATLLSSRNDMIKRLPQKGVVAELGVDKGDFSKIILENNFPSKLHLVDFWGSKRYNIDKKLMVENRFSSEINNNKIEINLGLSTDVVSEFDDNYFDWIYIDTSHSYQGTKQELELYCSKVKQNGFISGHDYIIGNWDGCVRYGVKEAVHEFCIKYNWEIIYLTTELTINPSFAIRRR